MLSNSDAERRKNLRRPIPQKWWFQVPRAAAAYGWQLKIGEMDVEN